MPIEIDVQPLDEARVIERKIEYNPSNPHPLSQVRGEFVWDGKYDEWGNRRMPEYGALSMPLQTVESVDEPRSRTEAQGNLFDALSAYPDAVRNRLIWGDNKLVAASLLSEYRGSVDLIYIDPPFDVGADFSMDVPIGDGSETVGKEQSALEMVAYRDMWGMGANSYSQMLYERLVLFRELLSESGSILVHCDWHMSHVIRGLLDEVFGRKRFVNEIVWYYYNKMQGNVNRFAANHDTIFWYAKGDSYTFNKQVEDRGQVVKQLVRVWDKSTKKVVNAKDPVTGKAMYQETSVRTVDDVWRLSMLQPADRTENVGYATQKPEKLVERLVGAASNPGDLVADFFCGSGTTPAVAERLNRRWIASDLGRFAIHTTRKRMIEIQRTRNASDKPYRPFDVLNLGRYERQWWQQERLAGANEDHQRVVLEFYRAEPVENSPSPLIHGRKGGALCHVDDIDGIFTAAELTSVAAAAVSMGVRELVCLAWEFEMGLSNEKNAIEAEHGLKVVLIQIPREIMEKNRTSPPPFLEVAKLAAEPVVRLVGGKSVVDMKLTEFVPSLAEVPSKELEALQERAISSGFDFIDFWAVDFDFRHGQPFHHDWQDYRTRGDRTLKTVSDQEYEYGAAGAFTACIKVIDIFGADTSITVEVKA